MKVCDGCGVKDDNHHNAVGGVSIQVLGYHYDHWSHKGKKQNWSLDLCPKCAGRLKDEMNKLITGFPKSADDG